jgi:enoyl-CoA hydratase/carnithine racemase
MNYKVILLEKKENIAIITLNRPPMNLEVEAMFTELKDALEDVSKDDNIRAVILTGSGDRAFCAAADASYLKQLGEFTTGELREWLYANTYILPKMMHEMDKVVIAAINGACIGGALLVLGAEMIIASENAFFMAGFTDMGLITEFGANYFLPRMVGVKKAREICFLNERVTAQEAERIGLVNRVVPLEKLMDTAMNMAKKAASKAPKTIAIAKSCLNRGSLIDLETCIRMEAEAQAIAFSTEDSKEAIKAFLEKRKPVFKGQVRRWGVENGREVCMEP